MNIPHDAGAARSHVLLQLDESAVRAETAEVIATDETLTSLTADDVTEADIHAACRAVIEQMDLSEELGAAVFRSVLKAIREGERRSTAST
jgi:predicted amino acid dehydrogenase